MENSAFLARFPLAKKMILKFYALAQLQEIQWVYAIKKPAAMTQPEFFSAVLPY
jgi:hypothetical protein